MKWNRYKKRSLVYLCLPIYYFKVLHLPTNLTTICHLLKCKLVPSLLQLGVYQIKTNPSRVEVVNFITIIITALLYKLIIPLLSCSCEHVPLI